jgi:hypothetical protein
MTDVYYFVLLQPPPSRDYMSRSEMGPPMRSREYMAPPPMMAPRMREPPLPPMSMRSSLNMMRDPAREEQAYYEQQETEQLYTRRGFADPPRYP